MNIATAAREAAVNFEAKKTGFGQAQDGWSLTLRIQDNDVPAHVRDAKKGTRYMVALVEIGDDEQPVNRKGGDATDNGPAVLERSQPSSAASETRSATQPRPAQRPAGADKPRQPFGTLPYSTQAAIRCDDPIFRAFLREMCAQPHAVDQEGAKKSIYHICHVGSRADIKPGTEAETYWLELERWFDAWKTKERVA